MFKDMRHAGRVGRRSHERIGEEIFFVVIEHVVHFAAGFPVAGKHALRIQFG